MIKEFIENNILNKAKNINYKKLENISIDMLNLINTYQGNSINQKIYNILNDIYEVPKCKICNKNDCKFVNLKIGYVECCSNECSKQLRILKIKETCLKKYRCW